jgi:hypothetical protein
VSQDEAPGSEQPVKVLAPSFTGKEAMKTHAMLVVSLALCALAFWIELGRAERGNGLSWAYVFEWPLLGGFAIYMWWKFLHPEANVRNRRQRSEKVAPEYAGMLVAWQEEQRKLEVTRRAEEDASIPDDDAESERATDQ